MAIRAYRFEDRAELLRLHQEFAPPGCQFPDPDEKNNFRTFVDESEDGEILGAIVLRRTVEAFGILNGRHGTPESRRDVLGALIYRGAAEAASADVGELHAALDPRLSHLGPALESMCFTRDRRDQFFIDITAFGQAMEADRIEEGICQ